MSMIERVKEALIIADSASDGTPDYDVLARAAICAMREPTEEMIQEGSSGLYMPEWSTSTTMEDALEAWQAMISAALKD